MGKMIITAYTDGDFNSECKSALELPVNPAKVKLSKGSAMQRTKRLGEPERIERLCALPARNLQFRLSIRHDQRHGGR